MHAMRGGQVRAGKPQPINRLTLRRVLKLFLPYKSQLFLISGMVIVGSAFTIAPPFLLQHIVNDGIIAKNLRIVTTLSTLTLLITVSGIASNLGYGYMSVLVGQRIMRDVRNGLFEHLQAMSLRFFTSTRTGEIQSRLANDVGGVQSVVSDTAANLLSNLVMVVSSIVGMALLDWRLTLLSIGVTPLFAVIAAKVGEGARKIRQKSQEQLADLNSTMAETLSVSGALLTKTSGRQALTSARFAKTNEDLTHTNVQMAMIFRMFGAIFGLTFSVTPVLVYWLAGYLIVGHQDARLTIGTIVAFTALQGRMFFPLTGLLNVQVELGSAMALFDRIFEYLDMPIDIKDATDAIELDEKQVRGDVSIQSVTFRYDSTQAEPTLNRVSLSAKSGQLVALVGASGAGKTTVTYLIPRLYDADSGSVSIDGTDVKHIRLASLGKLIAVVTQETYLVHDTIRENLRYGKPDASNDEIEAAAKAAAIHDHIVSLPDGYDTVVGERGYKLSGGEKQRVSIARALLKNPRILILDEATSALDTQSERLVQSALSELMKGRTTFAIAHRLSTIQRADQIVVMQKGKVIEQGKHSELLSLEGEYARLYNLGFEEADS